MLVRIGVISRRRGLADCSSFLVCVPAFLFVSMVTVLSFLFVSMATVLSFLFVSMVIVLSFLFFPL